jgi:hypothetical protein
MPRRRAARRIASSRSSVAAVELQPVGMTEHAFAHSFAYARVLEHTGDDRLGIPAHHDAAEIEDQVQHAKDCS